MAIGTLRGGGTADFAARKPATAHPGWRIGLRVFAVVTLLGALGGGGYWAATSGTFAIARVESGAYRYTHQDDLERVLTGFLGRNLWSVSTDEVATELAHLPWVRDLQISRRLPNSLEIDFREWRPLLIVDVGDRGEGPPRVLVEDGRLLTFPAHLPPVGLPVLTGAVAVVTDTVGTESLARDLGNEVLSLMRAIEETGLEAASPVDFLVAGTEGLAVVLQDGRGTLRVGHEDFAARLRRYLVASPRLEPGLEVDLRFDDRLTWTDGGDPRHE